MKTKQTEIKIIIIKRNIMKRKKEREEKAMKRVLVGKSDMKDLYL